MDELKANLQQTREQLVNTISSLSYDAFNQQTEANEWNIAQVCRHLVITETLFARVIKSGLHKQQTVETTRMPIHRVLDRSKKFAAPKIAQPGTEPIQVDQMLELLNDSRTKFMNVINNIADRSLLTNVTVKHDVFGDLPLDQWIELLFLHEQRHIEQIKSLKNRVSALE